MNESIKKFVDYNFNLLIQKQIPPKDALDLLATLVLWKFISHTYESDSPGFSLNFPSKKFFYQSFVHSQEKLTFQDFTLALNEWENRNDILKGLLNYNERELHQKGLNTILPVIRNLGELELIAGQEPLVKKLVSFFETLIEHLTRILQFGHLYFTPTEITNLMIELIDFNEKKTLLDPYCRTGEMIKGVELRNKTFEKIVGKTNDQFSWKLSSIRSILLGVENCKIVQESFPDYSGCNDKFDVIITNPPFGKSYLEKNSYQEDFNTGSFETDFLNYSFKHLKDDGQIIMILPVSFLSKKGVSQEIRKRVINERSLETIINLPSKIFYKTGTLASILVFNRRTENKKVLMIDATNFGKKNKDRQELSPEETKQICALVQINRLNSPFEENSNFRKVSIEQIIEKDFDLQFSTYKEMIENVTYKSSEELWNECLVLEEKILAAQDRLRNFWKKDY